MSQSPLCTSLGFPVLVVGYRAKAQAFRDFEACFQLLTDNKYKGNDLELLDDNIQNIMEDEVGNLLRSSLDLHICS